MKSTFKAVSIIIAILLSYSANAETKDRKNSIETTTQLAFDQLFNVLLLKKNEFETTNELTERKRLLFNNNIDKISKKIDLRYKFNPSKYDADNQQWSIKIANSTGNKIIGDNFDSIKTFTEYFVEVPLSNHLYQDGKGFYPDGHKRGSQRNSAIGPMVDVAEYFRIFYFPEASKQHISSAQNGYLLNIPMSISEAKTIGGNGTLILKMKMTSPFIAARIQQVNTDQLLNGFALMTGNNAPKNNPIENIRTNYLITEITGFTMLNSMNLKVRDIDFPATED